MNFIHKTYDACVARSVCVVSNRRCDNPEGRVFDVVSVDTRLLLPNQTYGTKTAWSPQKLCKERENGRTGWVTMG